jgi:mono/diheme cytochrome c family protein
MKILAAICALLFSAGSIFGQGAVRRDTAITAVTGESWLRHLHRSFEETSMGKTFRLGPLDPATDLAAPHLRSSDAGTRILHGSDLYRLNCQGCHGELGLGAPPEIGSVINPVRATSSVLVSERMKKAGMEISRRQTAELVSQSRDLLLKRLHEGGQDMPSFHYLREAEIRSLVAYLEQLAGVPGAEQEQVAIQESHDRIGELIVKSTCHTCHGATGLNPTSAELFEGAIPPLSVLPARVNRAQLVRKVTSGAPVVMGTPSSAYRGRMPVFSYLSEDEAADIYKYLTRYPPVELASVNQGAETSRPGTLQTAPQAAPSQDRVPREPTESVAWWMGVGLYAAVLLGLMCWITWRELRRLAVESQVRRARSPRPGPAPWVTLPAAADRIVDSQGWYAESSTSAGHSEAPARAGN